MSSLSPGMPLDAEGDCLACGHHPQLHGPAGCHERIHDADLNETTCDCEKRP